ncbi:MAG: hypothetical protein PVI92_00820 [Chromatiales bacterium]|jgi:hypothetical protein
MNEWHLLKQMPYKTDQSEMKEESLEVLPAAQGDDPELGAA